MKFYSRCFYCEKLMFKPAGYLQIVGIENGEHYVSKLPVCKADVGYIELQRQLQVTQEQKGNRYTHGPDDEYSEEDKSL